MAKAIFPDTTVLCSFAAVHRLDLLEEFFRGRGRWVEAVAFEVGRSARHLPDLANVVTGGWMGQPIEIVSDRAVALVEHLRRDVFGGTAADPLKHLGEAQTCYLLKEEAQWRGSWWVSDDRDALEFARRQGLVAMETVDLARHLVADGDLTAPAAFALLQAMADQDRALRLPSSVGDLLR